MNDFLTFPAFRSDGVAVQLAEVLAVVPDNDLVWSILEFNGMGEVHGYLTMDEFESKVNIGGGGLLVEWHELKAISKTLEQVVDCVIVGARTEQCILDARVAEGDFSLCEIVLSAFDSTEWSVWARDPILMSKLLDVY